MDIEERVGIGCYITSTPGMGGRIKESPEDFYVEEVAKLKLSDEGHYVIIRVKKVNWDTLNFARVLAKKLGISQKRVEYAGTKDKRAISVQYFSISKLGEEDIERLKNIRIKDAEIEIVGRSNRGIDLGDLLGNKFRIRVHDARDGRIVESTLKELDEKGTPNFFGLQRFGTIRFITHEVGKYILKREYENAFWTYVAKPFEGEREDIRKIREELWNTRDAKLGLREFPSYLRYERILLQGLREGKDEERALLALPKNLKLMFVHAYQSYVFNRLLTTRIEEFGNLKVVQEGDCVGFVSFAESFPELKDEFSFVNANRKRVEFLISQKRAYLALPLPGYETKMKGWVKEKVEEILDEDGIRLEDFRHEHREFSSKGSYRVADMPFSDFTYEDGLFSFYLPKGCYATVLLREFTKTYLL
ncbi:tRNA pseudouridine(13) synthase TruD [Archaeoglobus veneficus]|uniref:Probable tRNA pseudouridine synthase D n=1 Tax=Archaeoglobus veneficus (strain DSM 11195 / SNP6) TaxID=693661 RepID=F2KP82_ARCVS|nr:tRNA pseudouridine(13) synthase TruD [Archaeoglobus veneficus]AEA47486.1 tRNA pseudouridine synthase D [Archaeoglobus veneficus SNP6]